MNPIAYFGNGHKLPVSWHETLPGEMSWESWCQWDFTLVPPLAGQNPTYARGIPSLNPVSPGGFSPQSPHLRGSFQATCEAGTPCYKLPLSGLTMSLGQGFPWLKVPLLDPVWGRVLTGLSEYLYLTPSSHGLLHGKNPIEDE